MAYAFDSLMKLSDKPQTVMVEGRGSYVRDQNGVEYLDFLQGWAVNCLGHSPARVVEAIQDQAARIINCSPSFYNEPMIRLAEIITEHSVFDRVFFCNSGAEANEGAIKLARKWGAKNRDGAFEIITMKNAFHGRTLATMSASGKPQWAELFEPKVPGFPKVDINDLEAVKAAINQRTVAVMLEPIQGEGGVIPAEDAFMVGLRELTRREGILLIVDEVQTGMGRTGKLFAYQLSGIEPDIMTLGKGLGGGVPLAALVAQEAVSCFDAGDQGGTFNGNPLVTAAGCAVFAELLAPGFLAQVEELSGYMASQLRALSDERGFAGIRGQGMLLALLLGDDIASAVVQAARERGLILNAPRPNILRFMPALNVTRDEIDKMLTILRASLDATGA